VTADEAAAIGLVNAAFDDETFRDDVQAIVDQLAAKAPLARRGMKAHYVDAESIGFADFIVMETKDHGTITASDDCKEAFRAFVEKRPAQFQGK
jgi:enoyl-CoA hydratase